jgi:hypothetical protein
MNQAPQAYTGNGGIKSTSLSGMAGMPAPPKPPTPLHDRLQTLADVVTALDKRVQDLAIQLGPVLMASAPTAAGGEPDANVSHGYVVDSLSGTIMRLNLIADAIDSIQNRLVV